MRVRLIVVAIIPTAAIQVAVVGVRTIVISTPHVIGVAIIIVSTGASIRVATPRITVTGRVVACHQNYFLIPYKKIRYILFEHIFI